MDETRIDKEYDVDDWCFLSGSESNDLDWSIKWLKHLGSDFESNDNDDEDDSGDDSFVVLVLCYSPGCKEVERSNNMFLKAENRQSKRSSGQFD
ncbi:hypothetical protein L195_g045741 [Trifolium pratense]|uniref:Uncharacterized protein n=1 Tax=Trifolium pratense TaxID=57577 RepID=A0A2K3MFV9_TRIPR|nr:hypothetical protein L195_g045741 [Trifolium pratense]